MNVSDDTNRAMLRQLTLFTATSRLAKRARAAIAQCTSQVYTPTKCATCVCT